MGDFSGIIELAYGGEKTKTADPRHPLGALATLPDGRIFRYVRCSSTALTAAGTLLRSIGSSTTSTWSNTQTVATAHAVGTTTVSCNSTAAAIVNELVDGYLVVTAGAGAGETYKIVSNTVGSSATAFTCTFEAEDGLITAWATGSTDVDAFRSPWRHVYVNDADAQTCVIGVNPVPVDASYYFWAQCQGACAVKADDPTAAGLELDEKVVVPSDNHAGQAMIITSPGGTIANWGRQIVGRLITEADMTDNEWEYIYLSVL